MANRYWVGGTGNWGSTSKWSTSSGGSGGASVPTSSDDVIFDSNSGVGFTVTIPGTNAECKSLSAGLPFTITGTGGTLNVFGNITNLENITFTGTGLLGYQAYPSIIYISSAPNFGAWDVVFIADVFLYTPITTTGAFYYGDNTKNTTWYSTGNTITCNSLVVSGGSMYVDTVKLLGTSTAYVSMNSIGTYAPKIVQTSGKYFEIVGSNPSATFSLKDNSTSTINISGNPSSGARTGTLSVTLLNSPNYVNSLVDMGADTTLTLGSNGIYYVNTFTNFGGIAGNLLKLRSSFSGIRATIQSGSSGDTRVFSYLDVKDSSAYGATWYAPLANGCVDSGNNQYWNFTSPPSSSGVFMQFF